MTKATGGSDRRIVITFPEDPAKRPDVEFEGQFFGRDIMAVNRAVILAHRVARNKFLRDDAERRQRLSSSEEEVSFA